MPRYYHDSPLLKLPTEIFLLISENAHTLDRITLALTCKDALAKSLLLRLQVPSPFFHRTPWSSVTLDFNKPLCHCGGLEPLLRRLRPRNPAGYADRAWKLCVDCMRYRPRRAGYWHNKRRATRHVANAARVSAWKNAVTNFRAGNKSQCPKCRMRKLRIVIGYDSGG
ncbi:hypothetical protein ACRE_083060 [Hapsidospora chrysogenum ATCC 11550]|uniref:F-box domain-containing protein n=1 Tax=Hapsidospora chrysogenum (strain ATCC 11550 / CBS 779.69 / DSM 880 / IAM 14645 / JCM 23072 / IMI 49137) TaxID=857340 RepID=A0A086SV53_HAPC1|nr:hypothetical protein ACRE_083060 [Hapsidospora chrysogenum ATCC 11550]